MAVLAVLFFMNASGGVGKRQNKDRTGSPVMGSGQTDGVCVKCHSSGVNYGTVATMTLNDSLGAVTEYIPGVTYRLKLIITDNNGSGHGFQITCLLSNNQSAGLATPITKNTQKSIVNNRWYFEHSQRLSGGDYEMDWIAPAAGSGTITFYGSALAVNGNGKTTGDQYVNIPNLVITQGVPNGISDIASVNKLKLFPNPTNTNLNITNESTELDRIEIYSISGDLVYSQTMHNASVQVDVSNFGIGTYFVKSYAGNEVYSNRFIKN